MIRKDYLQKQIDQLGEALSKLLGDMLGLKTQGKEPESFILAQQTLKKEMDWDITDEACFARADFVGYLLGDKKMNHDNLEPLSQILYLTAFNQINVELKKKQLIQLLELFKYLENHDKNYSFDRYLKMEQVEKELMALTD